MVKAKQVINRTKSITVIKDCIEYNCYPPPKTLLKVMKRRWALPLIRRGSLRLCNVEYYQRWENGLLGDPNDGKGLFHMNGHPYTMDYVNPIFVWCTSLTQIPDERILEISQEGKYDCMIKIGSPEEFFQRILRCIQLHKKQLWIHCGKVIYNRGQEVDKKTMNSQRFNFNVFQKSNIFRKDREYRLSITDVTCYLQHRKFVKLSVGNCSDIIKIMDLPIKPLPSGVAMSRQRG